MLLITCETTVKLSLFECYKNSFDFKVPVIYLHTTWVFSIYPGCSIDTLPQIAIKLKSNTNLKYASFQI